MDIAVQLEKIRLTEDRAIFKVVGILKGYYDSESGIFLDELGYEYDELKDGTLYCERYFCAPTTMNELTLNYGDNISENEILEEYLSDYMDIYYLAYYDYNDAELKVIEVNFEEIEQSLLKMKSEPENIVDFDPENNQKFTFDLKALNNLKNYESLEDVREFIDKLISASDYIKDVMQNDPNIEEVKKQNTNQNIKKLKLQKEESNKFNLAKLRNTVLSKIIGQDEAVYDLTRTIAINQTSPDPRNKSHILISGPSGTGKTEMVRVIAKELDIPFFSANTPDYTKAGYYGKEVPDILLGLLRAANGDLEKAQHGILILDEIDKLVTYKDDNGFGKAVLHELLKILDKDIIEVDLEKGKKEKLMFNTSDVTVICMGSFDEIYEQKQQNKKNVIGFGAINDETKEKVRLDEDDFISLLGPEFVGRIGNFTETDELTHQTVLKILKESKISQYKIAKEDLEKRGVKLYATPGYLNAIAKKGYSKKLGVRKLNKEVKKTLNFVYDEILTNNKVKTIKLTKKTVENNKEYYVEY